MRLVTPPIVDYSGLIVDYFTSAARLGASARRVAHHAARRAARRRLLRLAPLVVDYSASRRLVVDFFASAARPGASARRTARRGVRRRLLRAPRLRLAATLALLQPHRAWWLLVSRQHWLYFESAARRHDVVFRSHRVDLSS
jgi:type VI protein secretion system component VasK